MTTLSADFGRRAALLAELPKPEPAAGAACYAAERERALAFSPARRENYARFCAAKRGERVDYLPIKLDFENVSRCNFRCSMCPVSTLPKGRRAADMALADFRRLIDEMIGLVEIKLQGVGEPLMGRASYFDMIAYARARAIWVRTTTNASLLHLNDNYRRLIDSDVNEVQISIDGADAPTFEAIRRGAVFEQVRENCRLINAYCRRQGVTRTKMWTVVQRLNLGQLEALVDLAAELGFTNQVFSLDVADWGREDMRARNQDISVANVFDPARAEALIARGQRLGVRVYFWTISEKYDTGHPDRLCPWPFERAVIASDLRVVPCCMLGNPDIAELGSVKEHGFEQVWFSPEFREFRDAHRRGDIPAVCRACYNNR